MQITLFIPGLTGPAARYDAAYLPDAPVLDRLLARGRHSPQPDVSAPAVIARLFGCPPEPGRDVPVAAVTHTVDAAGVGRGTWLRADPVYLRPDRRGAVLFDAASLDLDLRDALALAAAAKPVLEAAGYRLEMPCAERWYVRVDAMPDLRTVELDRVAGRDISAAMPGGADAPGWLRLLNEIQMVLHQCAANADRAARGLPPVNSVWFWGVGPTPAPLPGAWQRIHGTDLFLRGLAELAGSACLPVPVDIDACMADAAGAGNVLVLIEDCARPSAYGDVERWRAAVAELERRWFARIPALVRSGAVSSARILCAGLDVSVNRWNLLGFWRRGAGLAQLAPGVAAP